MITYFVPTLLFLLVSICTLANGNHQGNQRSLREEAEQENEILVGPLVGGTYSNTNKDSDILLQRKRRETDADDEKKDGDETKDGDEEKRKYFQVVKEVIRNTTKILKKFGNELGDKIKDKGTEIRDKIKETGSKFKNKIKEKGNEIKEKGTEFHEKIKQKGTEFRDKIRDKGNEIGNKIKETGSKFKNKIKEKRTEICDKINEKRDEIGEKIKKTGRKFKNKIKQKGNEIKDKGNEIGDKIKQKGTEFGTKVSDLKERTRLRMHAQIDRLLDQVRGWHDFSREDFKKYLQRYLKKLDGQLAAELLRQANVSTSKVVGFIRRIQNATSALELKQKMIKFFKKIKKENGGEGSTPSKT